ncbi:MAG: Rid family hydrolase [Bacteroidaceae bacterium]
MNYTQTHIKKNSTVITLSAFILPQSIKEYQVIIEGTDKSLSYDEQLSHLLETFNNLRNKELKDTSVVMVRYFLSDAANQQEQLEKQMNKDDGAISIIQQPPLNGTKIALWAYLPTGMEVRTDSDGLTEAKHGSYTHYWKGSATATAENSEKQTFLLLNEYDKMLQKRHCKIEDNCIRTWFFVQDIDVNYAGLVKARNEVFLSHQLTNMTHYIASTGIGGKNACPQQSVQMDTYAINGIHKEQIQYLYAKSNLSSTYTYGVSFERGTCIKYGDRRHVIISGTASIDNKGNVMWIGNIRKQALRVLENVEALLLEGNCTLDDLGYAFIYLRDTADYAVVKTLYDKYLPNVPKIIVLAPVCRAQWLIEIECMAIKKDRNIIFKEY